MLLDYSQRTNWKNVVSNFIKTQHGDEFYAFHPKSKKYVISNKGNVKSLYNNKLLSQFDNANGYKMVNIVFENGIRRCCMVHRLVMETFVSILGGDSVNYEVNHINGDKSFNDLTNLEWNTRAENLQHARDTGLFSSKRNGKLFKLTDSQVLDILEFRKLGFSMKDIAKSFDVARPYISKLIKNNGIRRRKCHS